MSADLAAVVLAVIFAALGHRTAGVLATGGYRIDGDRPRTPALRAWWPAPLLAVLAGYAAWLLGDLAGGAVLPAYLLFAWLSVALIWIDLDVHRLPVGLVRPGTAAVALLLVVASLAAGGRHGLWALGGALAMWLVFLALSTLPGGGMGRGDLRLAPLIGGLHGWFSPAHVIVGLIVIFLLGGLHAVAVLLLGRGNRESRIAYGPSMCLSVFVTMGLTSQILSLDLRD